MNDGMKRLREAEEAGQQRAKARRDEAIDLVVQVMKAFEAALGITIKWEDPAARVRFFPPDEEPKRGTVYTLPGATRFDERGGSKTGLRVFVGQSFLGTVITVSADDPREVTFFDVKAPNRAEVANWADVLAQDVISAMEKTLREG